MLDVLCPVKGCDGMPSYEFDGDPSGDHEVQCDTCKKTITFQIEFDPVAVNETVTQK